MDYYAETKESLCFMRHYINGKIFYRDTTGAIISYSEADPEFYKHLHAEELDDTIPMAELSKENKNVVLSTFAELEEIFNLEKSVGSCVDVISIKEIDVYEMKKQIVVFGLKDVPGIVFQIDTESLNALFMEENREQLYDFTLPRGIYEPYCVQFVGDDMIVY